MSMTPRGDTVDVGPRSPAGEPATPSRSPPPSTPTSARPVPKEPRPVLDRGAPGGSGPSAPKRYRYTAPEVPMVNDAPGEDTNSSARPSPSRSPASTVSPKRAVSESPMRVQVGCEGRPPALPL